MAVFTQSVGDLILNWLESEFGWGEQTARNYMNVASNLPESPMIGDLPIRTLYELAAPSVSDEVRAELVEVIEASDEPPVQQIRDRLDHEKAVRRDIRIHRNKRSVRGPVSERTKRKQEKLEVEIVEMREQQRIQREARLSYINTIAYALRYDAPPGTVQKCIEVLQEFDGGRELLKALLELERAMAP